MTWVCNSSMLRTCTRIAVWVSIGLQQGSRASQKTGGLRGALSDTGVVELGPRKAGHLTGSPNLPFHHRRWASVRGAVWLVGRGQCQEDREVAFLVTFLCL